MAFNAGEFRLKRLLGNQAATKWNARELGQLKLSPTTHQHLNRLLALSCIVEQPENFGVSLPAPARDDFLEHLKLNSPMDLRLAANLLGMPLTDLRRLNAAWRPGHEPAEPVASLLVPVTHVARFKEVLDLLPADRRAFWREQRVRQGDTLVSLASAVDLPADVLAIANGIAPHTELTADTRILLPSPGAPLGADPATHIVKQGDTLSAIAHRHGVKIAQLLRWNNLDRNSILHLDMQLQIRAPQY